MENTIFRSALGGFNRQDVMAYIEKAQKEAAETAQRLEEENETLRREGEELRQSLEALTQERDQLSGQTAELTEQCAGLRSALEAETAARETAQKDAEDRGGHPLAGGGEPTAPGGLEARDTQAETLRREKERVAQLELDAQQRAADVLAQAQTQAEGLLDRPAGRRRPPERGVRPGRGPCFPGPGAGTGHLSADGRSGDQDGGGVQGDLRCLRQRRRPCGQRAAANGCGGLSAPHQPQPPSGGPGRPVRSAESRRRGVSFLRIARRQPSGDIPEGCLFCAVRRTKRDLRRQR